jgi:serine/threonine protein kinase
VIGSTVSHYRIVSELGRGGMGVVYQATDTRLQRPVALKFLPDDVAQDRAAVERFQREARSASSLDHPNICAVYDVGEHEGRPFIVMQLLEGQTLQQRLRAPMPLADALAIATQVTGALEAAHAKGIVHRDVKPANIFVTTQGAAKVLDFGLAKLAAGHPSQPVSPDGTTIDAGRADLTEAGAAVGTIGYMSPEQARQETLDARTDLFSLGAVLYEMTTGRQAFRGATAAVLFSEILGQQPPPASGINPKLPPALDAILERALEKDRRLRYQSAADLRADLERLARDLAPGQTTATRRAAGRERSRLGAAAIAVAFGFIALAAWFGYRMSSGTSPIDSLAVLPFVNDSQDPDTEYLSDGLADSLISGLSQLPDLRVVPRSTAFKYKKQADDPQAVGQALGVRAVLAGHVVQRGDTLVVRAWLIDVARKSNLWSDQFDRKMADLLSIQHDISRQISDRLRVRLTTPQEQRLTKAWTQNTEAYRLYLKGLYHRQKTTEQGFDESVKYFQQAIDLDPSFPLAWAGLSDSYGSLGYLHIRPSKDVYPRAKTAALRALALDDTLAEAHAALGHAILRNDWDWAAAKVELDRAIALNPRYGIAHHWYAHYWSSLGQTANFLEESRKAVDCEPLDLMLNTHLITSEAQRGLADQLFEDVRKVREIEPDFWSTYSAMGLYHLLKQQPEEGLRELQRGVELSNRMPLAVTMLGYGYAMQGRRKDVEAIVAEFERRPHTPYVWVGSIYRRLKDADKVLEWFERGYREHDGGMIDVRQPSDPWYNDPRFQNLYKRVGFPNVLPAAR